MLGDKIKQLRLDKGLSQSKFAELFNVNRATLSNYEANKRKVPASLIVKIVEEFSVNPQWLFKDHQNMYLGSEGIKIENNKDCIEIPLINYESISKSRSEHDKLNTSSIMIHSIFMDKYKFMNMGIAMMTGDLMEPTLKDGDFLLYVMDGMKDSGIYVINAAGKIIIRRIQNHLIDKLEFICDNDKYQGESYSITQMTEKGIAILGKVVKRFGVV